MEQVTTRRSRGRDQRLVIDEQALGRLYGALPPQASEAEASLLGAIFISPSVMGDVLQVLRSGADFSRPVHAAIFDAMVEIYERTATMDIVLLAEKLRTLGTLDHVGGIDYLKELAECSPTASHAMEHARLVRDKAIVRELISASVETLHSAHQGDLPADEVLQSAEARIFQIAQRRETRLAASLHELLQETLEVIDRSAGLALTGVGSGFAQLDEMTSGFQPGELIILAARPSMGKTALALNLIEAIASQGRPVVLFSLEMGRQQLVQRLLCAKGGIDSQRLRRSRLNGDDRHALHIACDQLSTLPIHLDDTPALTLLQLRSKARRLKEKSKIEAIAIDYLQLMSSGTRNESRQLEISEISRGVKAMARELNVPVICLSQLNRASETRTGHRPLMSDLRESGSIEQDADVVMMLHREAYYHGSDEKWLAENEDKKNLAELILAKQRNGPTGTVQLVWESRFQRFRDFIDASAPGGYDDGGDRSLDDYGIPGG
ncbi:MAG: replicative DNA helicase [Phycisphaeraceae bacterium]|nr:replicative DNA helicase [Phycisphaeraceae bacterium]